jgi:OHCU decarboxylase
MSIQVQRIQSDIAAIAACTHTPGNGATRPTFSPAWGEARAYVIAQAEAAGCAVRTDAAGNVHARPALLGWDAPAWLVGSHIDSVPHGGDYDGVAGVVVGLELLRSAHDDGRLVPVELIVFAEEEGPTFGLGMLGSRAWVGELSADQLGALRNADGQTYLEAGAAYGVVAEQIAADRLDRSRYLGLIELHIEQGPGLWRRDQRLAVVTAIAGRKQYAVTVEGEANHAGATSMQDRRDALAGATEFAVALESLALSLGHGVVATVGRLEVSPNAVNVIPQRVTFTIDLRAPDDRLVEQADVSLRDQLGAIAKRRGLAVSIEASEAIPARPMDAGLVEKLGAGLPRTISGALHDSAVIAPYLPTVMLFVPSRDGISHNPAEFSRVEDVAEGARAIEKFVRTATRRTLNALSRDAFVAVCGGFFEQSPWIAARAWDRRPFASREDLHGKLCAVVRGATRDEQLGLIRAHPDLVGRLAREGRLTRESTSEQAAAGLTALSEAEVAQFERYNADYRAKFGFPFVICARENNKAAILDAFPKRLQNTADQEVATAIAEIEKIARLRLFDAVSD